ncbi:flagellar export protein FliJ [Salimicrobium humidisoli]|uniref:Flagellar FliJ protein n=1 Tax=Salimicrobium humidisoli TaxID=2029857 RepID=A0ABX4HRL9_9BACI|nr:flagellar export protein FliJ [Salimicrobium humidisoli]PBB05872.1 flagellar export protein FliJ [Salimicrobium humidisoli]
MNINAFLNLKKFKEREKDQMQKNYQAAVDTFEEKATSLYNLLKEKEELEMKIDDNLSGGMVDLSAIQHHQYAVQMVEDEVKQLHPRVQEARFKMNELEDQRNEAFKQVKKYEKLIELKIEEHSSWLKKEEAREMDEISLQQYSNRVNR